MRVYEVEKLCWQMRRDKELTARFLEDPDGVFDEFGVSGDHRRALEERDFRSILEDGANPYLVYFFALHIGVDRSDYYASVRGEEVN